MKLTRGTDFRYQDHLTDMFATLSGTLEFRNGSWWLLPADSIQTAVTVDPLPESAEEAAPNLSGVAEALLAALSARQKFSSMLRRNRAVVEVDLQSLLQGNSSLQPEVCSIKSLGKRIAFFSHDR
jgi:hypothetical protein